MKSWSRPRIEVITFNANEYVAACDSHGYYPLTSGTSYAADFGHYLDDDYTFVYDTPNGSYDGYSNESWYGNLAVSNKAHGKMWFNNIHVYRRKEGSTPSDAPYGNNKHFEDLGVFDVYLTTMHSFVYLNDGTSPHDQGHPDPTDDKYYS